MQASPSTQRLLDVLVGLHGTVGQVKYAYSAKVLKFGIISQQEIDAAEGDKHASEVTVWKGLKPTDVADRIAGGLTQYVDQEGYREKWQRSGMAEGSWKDFLKLYCNLKPSSEPFQSADYLRDDEMDNLAVLTKIFDEEIFGHKEIETSEHLQTSLKSKWWKECHRVFNDTAVRLVYYRMDLKNPPTKGICYTPTWNDATRADLQNAASRWRKSKLWDQPASKVDFTANNERAVKEFLDANNFNGQYLEGVGR